MSKGGLKQGESTVHPDDVTDNNQETSNPNELHLENLCIAEKSDQPSTRQGESTIGSPGTQQFRNTNSQYGNKGRSTGQSSVRPGNGSGQNQQYRRTNNGKGNDPSSKGNAPTQRQWNKNTSGKSQMTPKKSGYEAYMTEADVKKGLVSGQLIQINVHDLNDLEEKYKDNESSDNANNDNQSDVTPRTEHQGDSDSGSQPENKINENSMYITFQEVMKGGNDVVKKLFTSNDKEKLNSANRVLRRTGKVVAIMQLKHSRVCTGSLNMMNQHTALFTPRVQKIPRIMIPLKYCPKDFSKSPKDHTNILYISKIKEWRDNYSYAHGEFAQTLGTKGEVNIETEGILREYDVDFSEFTKEMLDSLPIATWQIPDDEITKRRDFRQQCVFTIDPATARDLDDALSCEQLDDGNYNVGVHIADVSYFLKDDSALDRRASSMATSVYLVQKVIPMLPTILSEELCSLNPNQDRLTFSVIWNISEKGEIKSEWFGRTVIRSCVKLSYDHAQRFIDEPEREWTEEELPAISNGISISQIKQTVLYLHKIAKNLRKARFDKGALHLDKVKLQFSLDEQTGMPNGYSVYKQKDSNRLVEEFMLLTNIAVADKTKKHFPDKALLRSHPKPQSKLVDELVEMSKNVGFPIDATSAGTIQKTLLGYAENDDVYEARMQVLVNMCCKVMQKAKYFCTGCINDEDLYRHYALNVPLYTHFTSPIRRYADVVVHRTLAAALDNSELSEKSTVAIQSIAENCNDRKNNAKQVSDLSEELFFAVFVKTTGPLEMKGMVMTVLDKSFDVLLLNIGVKKRIYCNQPAIKETCYKKEMNNSVLTLYWKPTEDKSTGAIQKISIFTEVTCILKPTKSPLQWMAILKSPEVQK
ncbi:DIS3-like exonuclease 2 [Mytilus trossulus]|uniref:DIS3-like exonuclease 2 n=1 Tax=Mytilus trossulus TaxID=6551 RepID=UPI0030051D43